MENSRMWAQVCPHSVSYQTGSVFTFIIDLAFDQLKSATWRKSESVFSARRPLAKLHKSLALTLHPSVTCWPSQPKYDQDFQHGSSPLQDVPGTEEVPEDQLVRLGGEGEDAHLQWLPHLLRRGRCIIIIYIFRPLNSQSILWNCIFFPTDCELWSVWEADRGWGLLQGALGEGAQRNRASGGGAF